MAKFLWKLVHDRRRKGGGEGWRRTGARRRQKLIESAGGTMEVLLLRLGDADVYVIADLPDNATAAGVSAAVNSSGAVELGTVTLLTPEEMDLGLKKAVDYQAPGS